VASRVTGARRLLVAAAAALTLGGGLLAGCGAGGATVATTAPTVPSVTAVSTPTLPSSELPGSDRPIVTLGDMNTPEQFILGQLYQLALQNEGYTVELTRNAGPNPVRQKAVRNGTLDIYPDYLGQWNASVAHLHHRFQTLAASYGAASAYAHRHGFVLLNPTPFSNTSGLAVTAQYAQLNHISSIAGLARGPGILLGAPPQFATGPDGMRALMRAYHLHATQVNSDIGGLQYDKLDSGAVQAVWVNTTDQELDGTHFRLLADPKHVFGFGNVVPVTTRKVLREEGPVFARTINRVDALLSTQAMRGLNAEEGNNVRNPTSVARQFLQGAGILPPSRYAPAPT